MEEVPRTGGGVHRAVLVREVVAAFERALGPRPSGWYLDGTVGAGGHARALLERFEGLSVLGCDWDPDSLAEAHRALVDLGPRVELRRARLSEVEDSAVDREPPLAVLADLGVCSLHLDRSERGFSFQGDGPLDMRMDPDGPLTAAEVVNTWSESDLADLLFHEGGERRSRRVAAAIVEARRRVPFKRTAALAETVAQALGGARGKTHPATRTFQALRRAVNAEGAELDAFLVGVERVLGDGGLLCVVTFHSGEDGVVKRFLASGARAGRWSLEPGQPIAPARDEVRANPRARSARLRVARRVAPGGGS